MRLINLHIGQELIENRNIFLEDMSEGTFIVMVLAQILRQFFIKNKGDWRMKFGETCLKAKFSEGSMMSAVHQ